jgi:hypothetical protein
LTFLTGIALVGAASVATVLDGGAASVPIAAAAGIPGIGRMTGRRAWADLLRHGMREVGTLTAGSRPIC